MVTTLDPYLIGYFVPSKKGLSAEQITTTVKQSSSVVISASQADSIITKRGINRWGI
jgi:hypothetical protein